MSPFPQELVGGDATENAQIIRGIFAGSKGPKSDCATFNAGFALYVSGKVPAPGEGVELARSVQRSGAALEFLDRLTGLSWAAAPAVSKYLRRGPISPSL